MGFPSGPQTRPRAILEPLLRSCFKTACRTDAAKSTGCVVTEIPPRSSGTLAGPARCWPPEAMSALEPWNTFRVQARTGCGGPSSSERFPCDSHGSGEGGPRCWFPELGASRWPRFPEWKRLRRGQRPRWTGIGRHVGLRKHGLSARHFSGAGSGAEHVFETAS